MSKFNPDSITKNYHISFNSRDQSEKSCFQSYYSDYADLARQFDTARSQVTFLKE